MNSMLETAVFSADEKARDESRNKIRQAAGERGIFPASIHGLYEAAGKGAYSNRTVRQLISGELPTIWPARFLSQP